MPVVLLCHCDGPSGSTTFVDSSPSAHTLTVTGTAKVNTATPKFGSGCADMGSTGSIIAASGLTDFNFGAGQFTLEAQAYFTTAPSSTSGVLTQFGGSSNLGWFFGWNANQLLLFYSTTGSDTPSVGGAFTPTLNTWYHLAADRDASNVLRVYVNGSVIGSATVGATFFASTRTMIIGNDENGTRTLTGRLDELRITKGLAQYGGAFTPPIAPFGGAPSLPMITMVQ